MQSRVTTTINKYNHTTKNPFTKLQMANQLLESGKLDDAKSIYCKALKTAPNHPGLLHMIGLIENELGHYKSAEVCLCKAIKADPTNQDTYMNLGQFYNTRNRSDKALKSYQSALVLNPNCPEVFCLIGDVYKKDGLYDRAVGWYQKSIKLAPQLISAHNNLGNCYQALNQLDKALQCYQQVLSLDPNEGKAIHNLGNVYFKLHLLDEAIACYEKALAEAPACTEIYNCLGSAYLKKRDFENAANALQKALDIEPDNCMIIHNIGVCLQNQGKHAESMKWFNKAQKLNPDFQLALMHSTLSLPVIYHSQSEIEYYRTKYSIGLDVLWDDWEAKKKEDPKKHLAGLAGWINFYLPYQGKNDLNLQKKFGRYLTSVMETNCPKMSVPLPVPGLKKDGKIRVGYVSENMFSHTVGKLFVGWIENADPSKFEIYCYHTQKISDSLTARYQKASSKFRHNFRDREHIAKQIVADKIHILVFLDIGMNAPTQLLAALKLAPVQCVAWGHPITTGLPSMDYFLSSDFMEPVNGQEHYSETLVKLPNLSIFYQKPNLPQNPKIRKEFGLRDDDVVYLSTQSLFKYLPEDDFIFADIARLVPNSKFVFLQHESKNVTDIFGNRVGRAFKKHQLDAEEFFIFQPRLSHDDFLSLNMVSDVLLDPPAWSGGMTSLEGLSCGLPVVTFPGNFMRSRHTYAMLRLMNVNETIAEDRKDYVRLAARLGTDRNFHARCKEAVTENIHRLYEDRAAIEALETFYQSLLSFGLR
jgi:predicted O-linked N-acetylglucosamine transferase (SPINDLY family)